MFRQPALYLAIYYTVYSCLHYCLQRTSNTLSYDSSFETLTKTRVNCKNCWQVFQSWMSQNFPKVTYPELYMYSTHLFNYNRGSHISLGCFSCGYSIIIELEFGDVGFYGGRKTGLYSEEKPVSQARTNL